jgi:GH24 family phage-related lysozyme (muramidase)
MNHEWKLGTFKGRSGLPYGGRNAGDYFLCHTTFRLTEMGITDLLNDDIDQKLAELGVYVKQEQLSNWPEAAILAVMDLIYQWGAAGIFNRTSNNDLAAAILKQDWNAASENVPDKDGGARTDDRVELFSKAGLSKTAAPPAAK